MCWNLGLCIQYCIPSTTKKVEKEAEEVPYCWNKDYHTQHQAFNRNSPNKRCYSHASTNFPNDLAHTLAHLSKALIPIWFRITSKIKLNSTWKLYLSDSQLFWPLVGVGSSKIFGRPWRHHLVAACRIALTSEEAGLIGGWYDHIYGPHLSNEGPWVFRMYRYIGEFYYSVLGL